MKKIIYTISLVAALLLTVVGSLFRIEHWAGGHNLLLLGIVLGIPYIVLGITDVYQNKKNDFIIKMMYVIGFIFLSVITGLVYLKTFRERN